MSRIHRHEAILNVENSSVERKEQAAIMIGGLSLSFFSDLSVCREPWLKLEKTSGTFYQSYAWCNSWVETVGAALNVQPLIVVAQTPGSETVFILPFQVRRKFGLRVLEWLTQSDNNYGLGLFDKRHEHSEWFDRNFSTLLRSLPKYDVLNLKNMPREWNSTANPLSTLFRFEAANHSYLVSLRAHFHDLHASKRSAKSISKIRRRDERLSELGTLSFDIEKPGINSKDSLLEILEHKNLQLAQQGIGEIFDPDSQKFLSVLAQQNLHIFKLHLDGKLICGLVGAEHNSCFWLMITALAPDAPLQFSPGDMLLRKTIEYCCDAGLKQFDFARGTDDYKLLWSDKDIVLYNVIAANTLRGFTYAAALLAFNSAKRTIKRSDRLRAVFYDLRKFLRGRPS
jgi:CelD/BcsL family acetyltransferase involved in cellulose biosynthesis